MDALLRHAHIIGTSTRVLRYLDRPLTKKPVCPDARSNDTVVTRMMDFNDGMRIMDIPLRASVSQDINNRFMDDLATSEEKSPFDFLIFYDRSSGVRH